MISEQLGQRVLLECWGSAQCWLTSISVSMTDRIDHAGVKRLRGSLDYCEESEEESDLEDQEDADEGEDEEDPLED